MVSSARSEYGFVTGLGIVINATPSESNKQLGSILGKVALPFNNSIRSVKTHINHN